MNPNKRIAVVFPDEFNGAELYRVKFSGGPFWQAAGRINFLTKKQAEALAAAWEASSPAEAQP